MDDLHIKRLRVYEESDDSCYLVDRARLAVYRIFEGRCNYEAVDNFRQCVCW